jgi:hypothetical protein
LNTQGHQEESEQHPAEYPQFLSTRPHPICLVTFLRNCPSFIDLGLKTHVLVLGAFIFEFFCITWNLNNIKVYIFLP